MLYCFIYVGVFMWIVTCVNSKQRSFHGEDWSAVQDYCNKLQSSYCEIIFLLLLFFFTLVNT